MVGIVYPPMKSWNDSMSANELVSIFTMLNHRVALGGMSISKAAMLTSVSVGERGGAGKPQEIP